MMRYQTMNREKLYAGRAFDVAKLRVKLPDGRERDYDLVEHGDSVTIIPIDAQGNLHFVTQHRIGTGDTLLELPAGVLDQGEAPEISALRELREEIGMGAEEMVKIGGFYLAPGYTDEYMTVFLARDLYPAPLAADEDEFLNITTLTISEAYQRAFAGEIFDGKTLAALLLAIPTLPEKEKSALTKHLLR